MMKEPVISFWAQRQSCRMYLFERLCALHYSGQMRGPPPINIPTTTDHTAAYILISFIQILRRIGRRRLRVCVSVCVSVCVDASARRPVNSLCHLFERSWGINLPFRRWPITAEYHFQHSGKEARKEGGKAALTVPREFSTAEALADGRWNYTDFIRVNLNFWLWWIFYVRARLFHRRRASEFR